MKRRPVLMLPALALCATGTRAADDAAAAAAALRTGGVVLALRHALAPGTYDPPGFKLGDCSTQRNLSDEGRAQARRLGAALAAQQLKPARVRSSPWCRCQETARLAFGAAEDWAALGSPRASDSGRNAAHLLALRQALAEATARAGRFEVWVTHNFVLADLVGASTSSAEGLVLRSGAGGAVEIIARLPPP
jgi:phosphohistidine phosphatase SixA